MSTAGGVALRIVCHTVTALVRIAEAAALEKCEAVEHSLEPCPLRTDSQGEWRLPCWARETMARI